MNIKLVAMDLDGTLLTHDHIITPETKEVLRQCEKRGVLMTLASGRAFGAVRLFAQDAGINGPIISTNGARVDAGQNGPTLLMDCIPPELSRRIAQIYYESGIYSVCYTREVHYNIHLHGKRRGLLPTRSGLQEPSTVRYSDDEQEMFQYGTLSALKYVAFAQENEMEALERLRMRLRTETDAAVSSSWFDNVETLAPGAGKGKAIGILAERFALRREEIMSFGDQMNDSDMLSASSWPVAMGNAVESLKRQARIITKTNEEDGVADALRRYVLGGEEP